MVLPEVLIFSGSCVFCAVRAYQKGYDPLLWFFAGSVIGLLIMAFLPFTTRENLPHYLDYNMIRIGNSLGFVIMLISVAIMAGAATYYLCSGWVIC